MNFTFLLITLIILIAVAITIVPTYGIRFSKIGGTSEMASMFIQDPWYTEIVNGNKTVEGRAASLDRYQSYIGKQLKIMGPNNQSQIVTVTAVRHYPDLETYIESEGWKKIAPHTGSNSATKIAYLKIKMKRKGKILGVFSPSRVAERGGMCAIEIKI